MRMLLFSLRALCVLLLSFQAATALVANATVGAALGASNATAVPAQEANVTKSPEEKYREFSLQIEDLFKKNVRSVTKSLLPDVLRYVLTGYSQVSARCLQSLNKYVMGLTRAKMWSIQMMDATSKVSSGLLTGTFSDYGSFDECLDVRVFNRDGSLDFQGSSCALEVKLPMPPLKRKVSLAGAKMAESHETLAVVIQKAQSSLSERWVRLIACVPSTCTLEDVRNLANTIVNGTDFKAKIPACYVSKGTEFSSIQIAVLVTSAILLFLGISGSVYEGFKTYSGEKISGVGEKMLASFSLTTNFERLVTVSGESDQFKCVHGLKSLSMLWVILAHIYIYTDYQTLKDPVNVQTWFATLAYEFIHNGFLSVDSFFLLSGMLATYTGLKGMSKTKGRLNLPQMILKRYLRLTPPVLFVMGAFFCLPLISSGPFWYEHVGRSLEDCEKYWWTNLLHFFNWWGMRKGCIETTWYVAADFQLHILSLFILLILYRYAKAGIGSILACILISSVAIAVQTWYWDLPASMQLSTGDKSQVQEMFNKIHIQTLTHLGPYCIGMALGYFILKHKEMKLSKRVVIVGWCLSVILGLSAVLGNHRFSTGEETSEALTILYAAVHRCAYSCGVSWVILACITGYGGPVNSFLSSTIMVQISRLTFMIYLIHPLVLWMKLGSMRERVYTSHYEFVYSFIANSMVSIFVAVPLHLLVEAPLANVERLLLGGKKKKDNDNHQAAPTERKGVTLAKTKPSILLWKRKSFALNS